MGDSKMARRADSSFFNFLGGSVQKANPFEVHTPLVKDIPKIFHKGCIDFKWNGPTKVNPCGGLVQGLQ